MVRYRRDGRKKNAEGDIAEGGGESSISTFVVKVARTTGQAAVIPSSLSLEGHHSNPKPRGSSCSLFRILTKVLSPSKR